MRGFAHFFAILFAFAIVSTGAAAQSAPARQGESHIWRRLLVLLLRSCVNHTVRVRSPEWRKLPRIAGSGSSNFSREERALADPTSRASFPLAWVWLAERYAAGEFKKPSIAELGASSIATRRYVDHESVNRPPFQDKAIVVTILSRASTGSPGSAD